MDSIGRCAQAVVAAADGDEALAKSSLHQAITYFVGVVQVIPKLLAKEAMKAVAERIPTARGSARKLRRQWKLPAPGRATGVPFWQQDMTPVRWWMFVLVLGVWMLVAWWIS
jgi:hypothetical protein